jgi:hypothetical protein
MSPTARWSTAALPPNAPSPAATKWASTISALNPEAVPTWNSTRLLSLGAAGDPTGLHGAQWIKGGTGQVLRWCRGATAFWASINGGQEPTGRLPFGPVFKVVLTNTDESTGTGTFGIYFRVCHHGFIDLGCTPYFIGPIPWFSAQEKGIVFVGETPGTPPGDIPDIPPLPPEVQQQIDALIRANEPDFLSAVIRCFYVFDTFDLLEASGNLVS